MIYPNPWRLIAAGVLRSVSDMAEWTLDDLDLMSLYLDARDEASIPEERK